jgi:hypothetical protein
MSELNWLWKHISEFRVLGKIRIFAILSVETRQLNLFIYLLGSAPVLMTRQLKLKVIKIIFRAQFDQAAIVSE